MKSITFQASEKIFSLLVLELILLLLIIAMCHEIKAQELVCSDTTFTQITDTNNFSGMPSINSDGSLITFVSPVDVTAGNVLANPEIYLYNTNTMIFTKITETNGKENELPSIDADGSHIVFQSDADFTGQNADGGKEVFLFTCIIPVTAHNVPTLSEWGLITMAGVLGIVGFMVIRRRKVTA